MYQAHDSYFRVFGSPATERSSRSRIKRVDDYIDGRYQGGVTRFSVFTSELVFHPIRTSVVRNTSIKSGPVDRAFIRVKKRGGLESMFPGLCDWPVRR